MEEKCCHEGHRERLRTRYINHGADSLFEHELLELLLFCAIPRKNTNEIGHALTTAFKNINGTFAAPVKDIEKIKDLGKNSAAFIKLFGDAISYYGSSLSTQSITVSIESFCDLFLDHFKEAADGLCVIVCPESNLRLDFFRDAVLSNDAEIKGIIDRLIRNDCKRIAIGINHGNRLVIPDSADHTLVKLFLDKCSLMSIELIDCIIVNKSRSFSFRQSGAISFNSTL